MQVDLEKHHAVIHELFKCSERVAELEALIKDSRSTLETALEALGKGKEHVTIAFVQRVIDSMEDV